MSDSFDLGGFGGGDYFTGLDTDNFGGGNVSGDDYFHYDDPDDRFTMEEPSFWSRLGGGFSNGLKGDNLKQLQSGASGLSKLMGGGAGGGGQGQGRAPSMPSAAGLLNKGQVSADTLNLIQQLRERSRQIASLRGSLSGGGPGINMGAANGTAGLLGRS